MSNHTQLDKLINIIQALNGNIFGETIRDYSIRNKLLDKNFNNINFNNINIIFNNNTIIKYFIRILSFNYEIYKESANNIHSINSKIITYNLIYNYLYNNEYKAKILKLHIFPISLCNFLKYKNIEKLTYDLDCNQFFMNSHSLYLNHNKYYLNNYIFENLTFNNFNIQFNRIRNEKFSFIKKNINFSDYIYNIDQAYSLVNNGWIMDDFHNPVRDTSCILLKWRNRDKDNYRYNYNTEKYKKLKNNDSCTICGVNFTSECIVINTSCNHNFHWYCNNNHGLKYWIQNHNNNCPICRVTNIV